MSKQHTAQAPVDPIVLGKMGSSYGIRGWLRVFSSTEDAESIFDYQPWLIQKAGQWQVVELESWRHHNQDIIIKLKGVDDRDAANLLTNCEIIVDSSQLPELEEGGRHDVDSPRLHRLLPAGGFHIRKQRFLNTLLQHDGGQREAFHIQRRHQRGRAY